MTFHVLKTAAISLAFATAVFAPASAAHAQAMAPASLMLTAANPNCGGLNQNSCWHADPRKWCDGDLKYIPGGIGRRGKCVGRPKDDNDVVDETPTCGGIGQASCWSVKPSRWCDAGLIYKPGGIPGRGRCEAPEADNMMQFTRAMASRYNALGRNNELAKLRRCLANPVRLAKLKSAMRAQSTNTTNSVVRECNVDPEKMQQVAEYVLMPMRQDAARVAGVRYRSTNAVIRNSDSDIDPLAKKFRLYFEFAMGAAANSAEAGVTWGYAIPLHSKPDGPRWYRSSDDYVRGLDLGAGGDVFIGLGFPGVPSGDGATESGQSGLIAAAVLAKVAMLSRITEDGDPSYALGVGAGLGITGATFNYTHTYYEDK